MEQPYIHENDIPRLACELHDLKGRATFARAGSASGSIDRTSFRKLPGSANRVT